MVPKQFEEVYKFSQREHLDNSLASSHISGCLPLETKIYAWFYELDVCYGKISETNQCHHRHATTRVSFQVGHCKFGFYVLCMRFTVDDINSAHPFGWNPAMGSVRREHVPTLRLAVAFVSGFVSDSHRLHPGKWNTVNFHEFLFEFDGHAASSSGEAYTRPFTWDCTTHFVLKPIFRRWRWELYRLS